MAQIESGLFTKEEIPFGLWKQLPVVGMTKASTQKPTDPLLPAAHREVPCKGSVTKELLKDYGENLIN